jgi:hypothetical protein
VSLGGKGDGGESREPRGPTVRSRASNSFNYIETSPCTLLGHLCTRRILYLIILNLGTHLCRLATWTDREPGQFRCQGSLQWSVEGKASLENKGT